MHKPSRVRIYVIKCIKYTSIKLIKLSSPYCLVFMLFADFTISVLALCVCTLCPIKCNFYTRSSVTVTDTNTLLICLGWGHISRRCLILPVSCDMVMTNVDGLEDIGQKGVEVRIGVDKICLSPLHSKPKVEEGFRLFEVYLEDP